MTRIFTEGAEAGDLIFWTTATACVNSASVFRISGRSVELGATSTLGLAIAGVSEFYIRFAWYNSDYGNSFRWYNGATELGSLRRNATTKKLDIYTGSSTLSMSGTTQVSINNWYVIELHVKIDDTVGVIEFKIDGILQTGFTGDTKPGADTTATTISFKGINFSGWSAYLDDIAFNDTAGEADNSWCGDGHIYSLTPNANGDSSQFLGSDNNSVDNYLLVDDIPSNSDTDYVASQTSGNKDLYGFTNMPTLLAGATVRAISLETRARELTADGDSLNLIVKHNSIESSPVALVLGVSYAVKKAEFLTNPSTSAAWTISEIDNIQAGFSIP